MCQRQICRTLCVVENFFRASVTSRICLLVLISSIAATVNGVLSLVEDPEHLLSSESLSKNLDDASISSSSLPNPVVEEALSLAVNASSADLEVFCAKLDFKAAAEKELVVCKRHWNALLDRLDSAIKEKNGKRGKRFSPISPTLPDRDSAFVLDRLNSLQVTEEEELIKNSRPSETVRQTYRRRFDPKRNNTVDECKNLTQEQLVIELKERGTYNPDLMAWDESGVYRFLDRSIVDQYEHNVNRKANSDKTAERNVEALERILAELHLHCDVRDPAVLSRLRNLTASAPSKTLISPSIRMTESEMRSKRQAAERIVDSFEGSRRYDPSPPEDGFSKKRQKLIGDAHVFPFGCDKRGSPEDGYLRLCGACQAIRRLPDTFFPPYINEVMCDEDKACLYFYNYRKRFFILSFFVPCSAIFFAIVSRFFF